jgi:hypothetical protein
MVLLVLMGVVGAVMGAWIKPRPAAVVGALALAAAVRALIGVLAPMAVSETPPPFFANIAFQIVQDTADDYAPLLSVAGASALIALFFALVADRRSRRTMTLEEATRARRKIRQGKFVRASGMVDVRKRESAAADRLRSLLGP